MTTQERHEKLRSVEYLDAMRDAWNMVRDLHKSGAPVALLVWRARSLYHDAWAEELVRMGGD